MGFYFIFDQDQDFIQEWKWGKYTDIIFGFYQTRQLVNLLATDYLVRPGKLNSEPLRIKDFRIKHIKQNRFINEIIELFSKIQLYCASIAEFPVIIQNTN